jgi:hypothetical protein
MKDLIESVANGLGWEVSPAPGRDACVIADLSVDLPGPRRWYFFQPFQPFHTHLGEPDRQVLILFAAYARAAMAKRGWFLNPWHNRPGETFIWAEKGCIEMEPEYHDPTSPVSEALAMLRCIDAAIKATSPFIPPTTLEPGDGQEE